ncbi:hypothetical protein, partial [Stenotrophomonas sp. 3diitr2024]|uniref:hypothetical protein n=1 Tax=Stenotrophomonas sp. 3diitr2024 TaxID=3345115 RepID=UPI0035CC3889
SFPRVPHYCSGCPHNTSTQVPEGSRALAGIGCHYMVTWMALVVGVLAFTAGFRPPGDGNNGVQATQWWMLGARSSVSRTLSGPVLSRNSR